MEEKKLAGDQLNKSLKNFEITAAPSFGRKRKWMLYHRFTATYFYHNIFYLITKKLELLVNLTIKRWRYCGRVIIIIIICKFFHWKTGKYSTMRQNVSLIYPTAKV